jgi:hypothetical protein
MTDRREHSPADTPYRGTTIAVGTRHGKQHQFALAFRSLLGAQLLTPPDLDTDRFGTFTGEVARRGAATEAARGKARLAMEITGLPYGLASEASYGVLPGGWFGHEEIVMFCDEVLGIEVVEGYRSTSVPSTGHRVARPADLPDQLLAGLPQQALTVRPCGPVAGVAKGVSDCRGGRGLPRRSGFGRTRSAGAPQPRQTPGVAPVSRQPGSSAGHRMPRVRVPGIRTGELRNGSALPTL